MATNKFGSRKFSRVGNPSQLEELPERKIATFRDFRRGFTPSEQRQMTPEGASPVTFNAEVRNDNRLQRVPGTAVLETFSLSPYRAFTYPSLTGFVNLILIAPPFVGVRGPDGPTAWTNLGIEDRDEYAATTFGGVFILTDGIRVWYKETAGSPWRILEDAPPSRALASFAARVFAGGTIIDGQFEPLGIRWSDADSNFQNWDGLGSGFELLISDISVGDEILSLIPMSLDSMAVMMRQSIWLGRFTGQLERPSDFQPRVTGVGAINHRVSALSRLGIFFLSDKGAYRFDGNEAFLVSEPINAELLPINYERLNDYHALYDSNKKRYILHTPTETWTYEIEHQRWLKRTFTAVEAVMFPTQIDGIRWFEAVGTWEEQSDLIWLDFAPKNLGELNWFMLGDQRDTEDTLRRVLSEESYDSVCFFGEPFRAYWESLLTDEQNAAMLVTSVQQLVEYEGAGCLKIYLPDEDNHFVEVLQTQLAHRDYPSTAIFNAEKVGKGTGIGIEFCEEPCDPAPPPDEYEYIPGGGDPYGGIESEWSGFTFFSDTHGSTPPEDSQQLAPLQIACFHWCNDEVCGGQGGWLVWYSNNPEELEQGCSHPNNPIPGMLA